MKGNTLVSGKLNKTGMRKEDLQFILGKGHSWPWLACLPVSSMTEIFSERGHNQKNDVKEKQVHSIYYSTEIEPRLSWSNRNNRIININYDPGSNKGQHSEKNVYVCVCMCECGHLYIDIFVEKSPECSDLSSQKKLELEDVLSIHLGGSTPFRQQINDPRMIQDIHQSLWYHKVWTAHEAQRKKGSSA